MQKSLLKSSIFSVLIFLFNSCSNNSEKTFNNWIGRYDYEEDPIKAIAGYSMVMEWSLSVNKKSNSYQGILEVNGQQTFIKVLADISGNPDSIAIVYNSRLDGSDENLKKEDTLFVLSKTANKLKTRWIKLEPRLLENPPRECFCFSQSK